jgi:hypothetical protein
MDTQKVAHFDYHQPRGARRSMSCNDRHRKNAPMSQTNAIILRIKADRGKGFEQLFKKHQYPNSVKHHAKGGTEIA